MSPFNFNLERERMVDELNESRLTRAILESEYGQVWSTDELCQMFVVEGFLAPFCVVRNKKTGQRGTVKFQHSPRFYFSFQPE